MIAGRSGVACAASGRSGVLDASATAEALAEPILDGTARSGDLRPFDLLRPSRGRPAPVRRERPGVDGSA